MTYFNKCIGNIYIDTITIKIMVSGFTYIVTNSYKLEFSGYTG